MKERLLQPEEMHLLRDGMIKLSAYHNTVKTHPDFEYRPIYVDAATERLAAAVSNGRAKVMALEDGGSIVGFMVIDLDPEDRKGILNWVFVEEAYRGQGYGGRLMDWAMAEFEAIQATQIDLNVVCGNPAAGLYEKYGFAPRMIQMTRCYKRTAGG